MDKPKVGDSVLCWYPDPFKRPKRVTIVDVRDRFFGCTHDGYLVKVDPVPKGAPSGLLGYEWCDAKWNRDYRKRHR